MPATRDTTIVVGRDPFVVFSRLAAVGFIFAASKPNTKFRSRESERNIRTHVRATNDRHDVRDDEQKTSPEGTPKIA